MGIKGQAAVMIIRQSLKEEQEGEVLSFEITEFRKEMEKKCLGIRQNMISDYERGRRTCSDAMNKRLGKAIKIKKEYLR